VPSAGLNEVGYPQIWSGVKLGREFPVWIGLGQIGVKVGTFS